MNQGIDVIYNMYKPLDTMMIWLFYPSQIPIIRPIYEFAYRLWASYRFKAREKEAGSSCDSGSCSATKI